MAFWLMADLALFERNIDDDGDQIVCNRFIRWMK
jgi:hypothetical protein